MKQTKHKIYVQNVHRSREHMHSNDYALRNRCRDDDVVQQLPFPQQTFFQLLHIMYLRTVDPLLKHTPDAVVHRIQIWRIGWPHLWRDKLLASLSVAWWQCHLHGERHDFSDVNITSPGLRDVHGTQRSKFTSMISIHLQSCVPKIIKFVHICKSYCEKISGTFFMWTRCTYKNTAPTMCRPGDHWPTR